MISHQMGSNSLEPPWLEMYASNVLDWSSEPYGDEHEIFYRRMGVVENMFDSDGELFEGRADLGSTLTIEVRTSLDIQHLRERILLVWTALCHSHPLFASKALYAHEFKDKPKSLSWTNRYFVYVRPKSLDLGVLNLSRNVTFVEDFYPHVDIEDFRYHFGNTARHVNSRQALSRLFVLPFERTSDGTIKVRLMFSLAHQVTDGLTVYRFCSRLIDLMNFSESELTSYLQSLLVEDPKVTLARLPPAQESLYPKRATMRARQRWQWLLTRILRHVREPPPACFQNPLRRETPLQEAIQYSPAYSKVLDYSRVPPLNYFTVSAELSIEATRKLSQLCKDAKITIGSGLFTLVAIVMMQFEESLHPDIPIEKRLPFVSGFPVNPRPFLSESPHTYKAESCMLAFSDGITLPFIPSSLDFKRKFKVLGRLTHQQSRHYQKRRSVFEEARLGSQSPAQLLPTLYVGTLERMEGKVPPEMRVGYHPQGSYPARFGSTLMTCGISSVGDTSSLLSSKYAIDSLSGKDLVADYRSLTSGVRPRDGEFLVGGGGDKLRQGFSVSMDGNAIDPAKAQRWKEVFENIIDQHIPLERGEPGSHAGDVNVKSKI